MKRHSPGTSSSSCPGQSQPQADPSRNFSSCRVRKKELEMRPLQHQKLSAGRKEGKSQQPGTDTECFPTFLNDRFTVPCGGGREGGKRGTLTRGRASRGRRVDSEVAGGDVAIGCAPEGVVLPRPNQIRGCLWGGRYRKKGREEWRRFHLERTVASSRFTAGGSGACGDVLRLFYRHTKFSFACGLGCF